MKKEVLYWEQNGEVKESVRNWASVMLLIKNGKKCGEWTEGETEYGYWYCELYVTVEGILIKRTWIPAFGYTWQETEVLKIVP